MTVFSKLDPRKPQSCHDRDQRMPLDVLKRIILSPTSINSLANFGVAVIPPTFLLYFRRHWWRFRSFSLRGADFQEKSPHMGGCRLFSRGGLPLFGTIDSSQTWTFKHQTGNNIEGVSGRRLILLRYNERSCTPLIQLYSNSLSV